MKKKSVLAALLSASMVMATLVGCGSAATTDTAAPAAAAEEKTEEAAEAPAAEAADEDVTITFMASQDWVQDAELELGEKFTEQTGIKVDYQIIPSDQYENLLLTKMNTGECADIFGGQSSSFTIVSQFNVEKNAVDLSGESWAANVDPAAAYELSVDGKLYGQPIQDVSACWAVAYNIATFEELGLSVPTSYAEFCDVCDAILAAGKTPVYECVSDTWHHTCWLEGAITATAADADLPNKLNNNEATFEGNPQLTTLLTQIKECADKGYWGDNYMSNAYSDTAAAIASGEYVMTLYNQGLGVEVNAVDPSFDVDNIGYFAIPYGDNQNLNVNPCGPSRFIYSGSKNIDAAKKYLEFMASDESLAYLTENVGKFNQLPYTNAPSAYTPVIQEFYDRYPEKIAVFQASVKYFNPQWMEMGTNISAMLLGEMTPDEVLADIDKLRGEQAEAASDDAWK